MLRAHRKFAVTQRRQVLANRALMHLDPEPFLDLFLQIDPAPPCDAVLLRIWACLHKSGQMLALA